MREIKLKKECQHFYSENSVTHERHKSRLEQVAGHIIERKSHPFPFVNHKFVVYVYVSESNSVL